MRRHAWIALLLMAQAIVIWSRVRGSYFAADDFSSLALARDEGLTPSYLMRGVFGQTAPGFRALYAVYLSACGLDYRGCSVIILVLSLASTWLLLRVGERLRAEPWALAAGGIIYISLLQHTHTQLWWAASAHTLPSLVATLAALYCLVGPDGKGPARRGVSLSAAWFGVGLLFTIKPLFAPIFFAAVLLYLRRRDGDAWQPALRKAIYDLKWLAPIAAVYCVVTLVLWEPSPGKATLAACARFVWLSIAGGTAATSLGLGPQLSMLPRNIGMLIAVAVVGGLAACTVRKNRANGILWFGLLTYAVIAMASVAEHRAGEFGATPGLWPRYNVENATLLVLVGVVGVSALRLESAGRHIAIELAVLVAVVLQLQSPRVGYDWNCRENRLYVDNVRESLRTHPDERFLNTLVPANVVPNWMYPANTVEKFLPLFGQRVQVSDHLTATCVLDRYGFVHPYVSRDPK